MPFSLTPPNGTRSAIFKAYEAKRKNYEAIGINVGDLGGECDRALWYNFRRVSPPEQIDGRKISIFETGDYWELRIIEDLRSTGVEVLNQQERVRFVGGHVRGKIDGLAEGVAEAPQTTHLLECKSSNDKGFKELQKKGVKLGKPLHYAQCQMYMHGLGLTRCLYVCTNKNDDDRWTERIPYDAAYCLRMLARAERIIRADDPPSRISEKPTIPPCSWCRHRPVCHEGEWARRNCRTCLHSTPVLTSENACWDCAKHNMPLSLDAQAKGCPSHRFIPSLVPAVQENVDLETGDVTYRLKNGEVWVNCDGA